MTTMGDLADEALGELYGYSQTVDVSTYLALPLAADDLAVALADASNFSRGLVQIGDELLMVDRVDRQINTLSLGSAAGRGVRATAASVHAVGDRVTMNPTIPRAAAVRAMGEILRSSSGLFAVSYVTFTADAAAYAYPAPGDVGQVIDVSWLRPNDPGWAPVRHWSHDRYSQQIVLGGGVLPGATVRVVYTQEPTVPGQDEDFTESGLPASCEDVARMGTAWKLSGFLEPQALMAQAAEPDRMGRTLYPTTRLKVSQYFYQVYRQRLEEEVQALQQRYPIRTHYGA